MMKLLLLISFIFCLNFLLEGIISMFFYVCVYMLMCMFMIMNYSMGLSGDYWILISGYMSYDSYSYYLILLSVWILSLMIMSLDSGVENLNYKLSVFNLVLMILVLLFSVYNLMLLYLFFEISLIPTFLIVLLWGGNQERISAAFFLIMYMMFISFPLLAYLVKIYMMNLSLDLNINSLNEFNDFRSVMGYWDLMILLGAFLIKLPVYMFHIWLPKAHVEAPVYGSMLLAAILLKLGGYGLLRMIKMFMDLCVLVSKGMMMLGAVYVSMLCLSQVDMKSLVAYSSVVHMNLMLCSLMSMTMMGFIGGFLVMISHGLCSSGLFFMVNLFYKRSSSRLIVLNRGLMNLVPYYSVWWFLLCSSNFAFPFSVNFIGEVIMIMVLMGWSLEMMITLGLVSFFSGAYSLYLFSMIYHGSSVIVNSLSEEDLKSEIGKIQGKGSGYIFEYLNLFMHYYPLLFIMINLIVFMF